MEFKTFLKDFLIEHRLSQNEFAKSIQVSQGTVSKWLSGQQEPRYFQLRNICMVYNLDANVILGVSEY